MKLRFTFMLLLAAGIFLQTAGQPARQLIQVIVTPDRADWTYDKGDRAEFQITVLQNNVPLEGIEVNYRINPEKVETSKYYDVVNFARFVKAPGWYSWGYNDNVCPPTSMHAACNVIQAPKELHIFQETQHWTFPEQREQKDNCLFVKLLK